MDRYQTIRDVVNQVVRPALGDRAPEFDVYAIAHATYKYATYKNADGTENAGAAGFETTLSANEFWDVVAENALSRHARECSCSNPSCQD